MLSLFISLSRSADAAQLKGVSPWMIGSNTARQVLFQYAPEDLTDFTIYIDDLKLSCDSSKKGFVNCTAPALKMGLHHAKINNSENTIALIVVNWTVTIVIVAVLFGLIGLASSIISYITCMLNKKNKITTDDLEPLVPKNQINTDDKNLQMRSKRENMI
ncbi:hypothetical protein TVAG_112950 [Trichomonas vaginalis G3]|uniref:Uncharacterized protein n=1 Tax=Trichomonas vaginalis (strain ATCC PRA-98 / G3) TaxID=412133 RepID=A2F742_TRIV3|nr:hypothetical protein TVAGG3_0258660 [Trichomonas vaginalis G3]EAX99279.1 hypothetical protein TVAG_112950 [Trichomonas vaginalis G3]KAI5524945.1 hypothetical protein TVAGG3_0258660 [Trichomonas vaginalis G3]|eukprot:XP_001312209.1 hypothetical protein [Trichomonas vaginalis G3]